MRSHNRLNRLTGKTFWLAWGRTETQAGRACQWMLLHAIKANGRNFHVWLLSAGYPPESPDQARKNIARYILQEGGAPPLEYRHRLTGEAVLPSVGGWSCLFPQPSAEFDARDATNHFPARTRFLGLNYRLVSVEKGYTGAEPPGARIVQLTPDILIGLASNTRQKDETRRYDYSDYDLVRLTREDFREMAEAGINCMHVDAAQLPWIQDLDVFYWGLGGGDMPYPECLYQSRYLGPTLFIDEPAVGTRDHVIRPRLAKEPAFRKAINPQKVFTAFQAYFGHALQEGAANRLVQSLAARPDVALGEMKFPQANLFSWETMISTAAYQLSQDPVVPAAMVFEPPGRIGTRRTLPELNMSYGCQLPADDPKNLTAILYGFLRGAARLTGKEWGTSIYGAVDRGDGPWWLVHAYDLGATRFFFWDNAQLACVPYHECLALARNLRNHAQNHPHRDLQRLKWAAETAILLPPGYNLGHVQLGRGNLWGLGELNLERLNPQGTKYRVMMANFFLEIERCLRLGTAFDLLWDLPNLPLPGYREVIHIREDGKVEVAQNGRNTILDQARTPPRPAGDPPQLQVELSTGEGKAPLDVTGRATVLETSAPVYYTFGADLAGVYHNAMVDWELYGPEEEDYRSLTPPGLKPQVQQAGDLFKISIHFRLSRAGHYRLRAATTDLAGRSAVVWTNINATEY